MTAQLTQTNPNPKFTPSTHGALHCDRRQASGQPRLLTLHARSTAQLALHARLLAVHSHDCSPSTHDARNMSLQRRGGPKDTSRSLADSEAQSQDFPPRQHSPAQSSVQPTGTFRPTGSTPILRPGDLHRRVELSRRRLVISPSFSSQPRLLDHGAAPQLQFNAPSFEAPRFQAPQFTLPPPPQLRPRHRPLRPQPSVSQAAMSQPTSSPFDHTPTSETTPASQPTPSLPQLTPLSHCTPPPEITPTRESEEQTGEVEGGDKDQGEASTSTAGVRELDPDGLWFDKGDVVRSITHVIKSYFHQPWKNYTEVDQATKVHWWNMWKLSKTNYVI